ncbi:S8 family peptidase [Chryseobacterium indoltheticum]|uniref:Por secretion system C-terminal sorting domain n=1 Tax=Chryseobacterium indoltheticum TaxID=254 RepID=A0A381FCF3_9FLAO|nr:S8 family peptidase [Chryseobacterium indoltheticum]AZA73859.1 T9SS C-terminal target domain-containing protein [Chryseobacterium indoltheticum]SIR38942.1 Por secretion system C-terminal sorting domain-containing protein [Chryseobacterium indoltheticum]SUX44168.1 Por secretion system C-terminal sorting domain [Chryseobacterium indoltheticum]
MKKHLLLVSTFALSLLNAQIVKSVERKAIKEKAFENYIKNNNTLYDSNKSSNNLDQLRRRISFVFEGRPYFYSNEDIRQVRNVNADILNDSGSSIGLSSNVNGEGIKYTVFDGGRVYAAHSVFDNLPNRITNKEASIEEYSAHATAVSGFIGARSFSVPGSNLRGIAMNSTIDSYMFADTTLPGNSSPSDVFDKIVTSNPNISNHSYGNNSGWLYGPTYGLPNGWFWSGSYSTSNNVAYDLQGTYLDNDANYDDIVYNNPSNIIVKSSGNYFGDGPAGSSISTAYYVSGNTYVPFPPGAILPPNNCTNGYDCISNGSLAKNIIVVGATNIITTNNFKYNSASDVIHSDYSSAGPRDDGGIKPDIVTTGTNVSHASTSTTGSNSNSAGSGTSYSAPVITGIIGLWTQISKQLFAGQLLNAASAKSLLIHSAKEAGNTGPDPLFGWGYADAKGGAEILVGKSNNSVIFKDETLTSGNLNEKLLVASGTAPLKITISWIDPAFTNLPSSFSDAYNNRSSRLINDLDLRVIDTNTNTTYFPWKLDPDNPNSPAIKADNTVDNVEQVILDNPIAGRTYKVVISHKGTLVDDDNLISPQNYSIIATGYSQELLGTDETIIKNNLIIAPTLTKDIVNILKAPKKSSFTVYDLSGKKLQSGVINSAQEAVSLSSYTNGIYIIEVKTDKDVISKKVIKE